MTIVPYMPLSPGIMRELVDMKLGRIADRLLAQHRLSLAWTEEVAASVAASCTAVDTGARNIDHVINATLLPGIATALLGRMANAGPERERLRIGLDAGQGTFTYSFEE